MNPAQRLRMIDRFHRRKIAAEPRSLEHKLCACVVLSLLYGGSLRTVNRISRWMRSDAAAHNRRAEKVHAAICASDEHGWKPGFEATE